MNRITKLRTPISFKSWAAVGGYEERNGPLGEKFDFCDLSDKFGQKTWEIAEAEMGRVALNISMSKVSLSHDKIELLVAGDLQNQCVASSTGLSSFGIPFLGVYGACSTCTESLMTLASFIDSSESMSLGAAVTSSHNSAAERQFRTPIEYGGQRAKTAQWTSTAAGAFILERGSGDVMITEYMPGRIVDGSTSDGANMGGAMAFAAFDSISSYFEELPCECTEAELIRAVWKASSDPSLPSEQRNPALALGYVKPGGRVTFFGSKQDQKTVKLEADDKIIVFAAH